MWAILGLAVAWATDCSTPLAFREAQRATWVAVLDVKTEVDARVVEVWKGSQPVPLVLQRLPDASLRPGRAVVFLGDDGAVHLCDRVLNLAIDDDRRLAEATKKLLAVQDAPRRVAMMVDLGAGLDEGLAVEALGYLASSPDLLNALDAGQRATLIGAIPASTGERAYALSWTLARLQEVSSLPAWIAWLDAPHTVNSRPIIEAMQLMTHHRAMHYETGHDLYGEQLKAVRDDFAAWWSTWGQRPPDEAWAASNADAELKALIARNRCEMSEGIASTALPASTSSVPACP